MKKTLMFIGLVSLFWLGGRTELSTSQEYDYVLESRVSDLESRTLRLKRQISDLEYANSTLESQVSDLIDKVDALESQISDFDWRISNLE